eukprot:maker-scaffold_17-snap-gene-5.52-mRNA-1 protein AED:0.18 eAED:0.18 QI:0/0.5/0.4/1/0.5/0.4/5/88/205
MFSLLAGFIKWLFSKTELHILIIGIDHAGKTTLLEQLKRHFQHIEAIPAHRIPPTVGLNIGKIDIEHCRVLFWDLGGQKKLRTIWKNYFAEAHGILFVLDSSDKSRFQEVKQTFTNIMENQELQGVPTVLCCNKQDLQTAGNVEEIEQLLQVHKYGTKRDILVRGISAVKLVNVDESVRWLIRKAKIIQEVRQSIQESSLEDEKK